MKIETEVKIPSAPPYHCIPRRTFRECAHAVGLEDKQINRLELAVGEALANVSRHCYGGATDRPIIVRCVATEVELRLEILDEGPCVNTDALPSAPTPCDEPGGLGLHLIRNVMTTVEFTERPCGGNQLTLIYKLPSTPKETE